MKGTVLAAIAALTTLVATNTASAGVMDGYVCSVNNYGTTTGNIYGSGGMLAVAYYSDANCSNYLATYYYCTADSTSPVCSDLWIGLRSEAQLMELHNALQQALHNRTKVRAYLSRCKGDSGDRECPYSITFYGPGRT